METRNEEREQQRLRTINSGRIRRGPDIQLKAGDHQDAASNADHDTSLIDLNNQVRAPHEPPGWGEDDSIF
ncbi:MAG: hypothetical protein EOO15_13690 [Chitinophagaceae bacterium]|nr:MAG: hypothetical protein EOO15_13690 [Chitinophagaceae bacterium]